MSDPICCKHLNEQWSFEIGVCNAFAEYRTFCDRVSLRNNKTLPCFNLDIHCSKREWPTDEEIALEASAFEGMMEDDLAISAFLKSRRDTVERDKMHKEACPVCGGELSFIVSSHNGHAAGQCDTEGCLNFRE